MPISLQGIYAWRLNGTTGKLSAEPTAVSDITPNPAFLLKHPTKNVVYASTECIHEEGCGSVVTLALDPSTGRLTELSRTSAGGRSTCYLTLHRPLGAEEAKASLSTDGIESKDDSTSNPEKEEKGGDESLMLAAVNYWDAIVSVLPVAPSTGEAQEVCHTHMQPGAKYVFDAQPDRVEHWTHRQRWPHTHCFVSEPYPATTSIEATSGGSSGCRGGPSQVHLVPDLGADVVWAYRLTGPQGLALQQCGGVQLEKAQGPRHLVFHPTHRVVYVINELKSTVSCLAYHADRVPPARAADGDAEGHDATLYDASADPSKAFLVHAQTLRTLPEGFDSSDHHKSHASEIRLHPSGRWLLIANRGHDSLACYAIDATTGKLTTQHITSSGGAFPRNFNFDSTGRWVVVGNQNSNCLTVFAFDVDGDGSLVEVDSKPQPSPNYVYPLPQPLAPSQQRLPPRSAGAFSAVNSNGDLEVLDSSLATKPTIVDDRASRSTSSLDGSGSSPDPSPPGSPTHRH